MIAGGVNPSFNGKAVKEIYHSVPCRKQAKRIKELEEENEKLLAVMAQPKEKEIQVRETIKEVVKEDASLVTKLNEAYRELAELRGRLNKRPLAIVPAPEVQIKEVEKVVEKKIRVEVRDWFFTSVLSLAALGGGLAVGAFLF